MTARSATCSVVSRRPRWRPPCGQPALPHVEEGGTLVDEVHAATGGVPLLLREAVRSLRTQHESSTPVVSLATLPAASAFITESLDCLGASARSLVQLAAVMSPGVDVPLLIHVAGTTEAATIADLDEARSAGGILADGDLHVDDVVFDHDLVRDVLLGEVSSARRVRIHRDAAAARRAASGSGRRSTPSPPTRRCPRSRSSCLWWSTAPTTR